MSLPAQAAHHHVLHSRPKLLLPSEAPQPKSHGKFRPRRHAMFKATIASKLCKLTKRKTAMR